MRGDAKNTWTCDALEKGDLDAVRKRVLDDPDYLVTRDDLGDTPLRTAVGFGDLELIRFLLQQGADPNVAVDDGYTCLLLAVESDHVESNAVVAALIAAGADIHQTGTNGWTPLHMAAAHGHKEKTRLLIDAGSNVNQRTTIDAGETPLMEAAKSGYPEIAQILLENGADASMRDAIHCRTALEIAEHAAKGPDLEVYKFLQQENIKIDVDEIFGRIDMPPEQLAPLKEQMRSLDMAECYFQNSMKLAEVGDHAAVIRILAAHTGTSIKELGG